MSATNLRKKQGRRRWDYRVREANGRWTWVASGSTDRRTAEAAREKHQTRIDRAEAGLSDPFDGTRRTPLGQLLDNFEDALVSRGRAAKYVSNVRGRLDLFAETMEVKFLAEATPQKVQSFLSRLLRADGLPDQQRFDGKGNHVPRRPVSMRTRDSYVEALQSFGSWLEESERWGCNPFGKLRKEATDADRKMEHRAFTPEQIRRLMDAAEVRGVQQLVRSYPLAGPTRLEQLTAEGWARGTLYQFAAYTGLRLSECKALKWGDMFLSGDEPFVVVRAPKAKNRREQSVPLFSDLVARLVEHRRRSSEASVRLGGRIVDGAVPVFWIGRNVVATLRKDARFAGLGDHDEQGRRTTFHGLRASTATMLANAGVAMAVAMRIMRHSDPRLTMKTYAKVESLRDGHRELKKLALVPTQAVTNIAPLAAAVGHSVPLGRGGNDRAMSTLVALD